MTRKILYLLLVIAILNGCNSTEKPFKCSSKINFHFYFPSPLMGEGQDGGDPKAEFTCYSLIDRNYMTGTFGWVGKAYVEIRFSGMILLS